jgi:nucleotide-binding universal stress UspA family protein
MSILIYYDGTEYEKDALATIKKHAKVFHTKVEVVSSISQNGNSQPQKIRKVKGGLKDLKAALENENIPCNTYLLMKGNYAGEDIVRFAEEHGADEIIISAEKRTRIQKLILGSVEQYLILNADCPVVIV